MKPTERKKLRNKNLLKRFHKGAIAKGEYTNFIIQRVKYKVKDNMMIGSKSWRRWAYDRKTGKLIFREVLGERVEW